MDFDLIVLPVSDVDRARAFYEALGFRLDVDYTHTDDWRAVHFTPPGSDCSILFGNGMTDDAPGSLRDLHLVVPDIEAARARLLGRGIEVGEVFHDAAGLRVHDHRAGEVVHHGTDRVRTDRPDGGRASYGCYANFSDPDGNSWVLEEVR
ncbi:VOC family protein [Streptomyces sp. NPDC026673]|uniref:VOC family protein n=1 Tax=Streptomyces sp. NPDC026673 TaxID=3155724 RepID=UPI0033FD2412